MNALVVKLQVDVRCVQALIDTGCTVTLVSEYLAHGHTRRTQKVALEMMDRRVVHTNSSVMLHDIRWRNVQLGPVCAHVLSRSASGVDVVLGLDTLLQMGLKIGWHQGQLLFQLGCENQPASLSKLTSYPDDCTNATINRYNQWCHSGLRRELCVQESDFCAKFEKAWWEIRWSHGAPLSGCMKRCAYQVPPEAAQEFHQEVQN